MTQNEQSHDQLRQSIDQLREQISALGPQETEVRERMDALVSDLEHKLLDPDDAEHHESLIENLKSSIESFETQHPTATGIMNRIMVTLGGMGI